MIENAVFQMRIFSRGRIKEPGYNPDPAVFARGEAKTEMIPEFFKGLAAFFFRIILYFLG